MSTRAKPKLGLRDLAQKLVCGSNPKLGLTILTQTMADEFNFLWSKINKNYIEEAEADLIPVQGQLELHGRCRCGVLLSPRFGALFVADLNLGVEELPQSKWLHKVLFKNNCFGTITFVKLTKQSLYKANSFASSLANMDKPVAATLQRKWYGGIIFAIITKIVTKYFFQGIIL